jgi:hypothetical protein
MTSAKLSVRDFYDQFHGHEHHNDPGEYTKPKHHLRNPSLSSKHKGLDLRALRNSKRKKSVIVHKRLDTIKYEMIMRKKAK